MRKVDLGRCVETVYDESGWHKHNCLRNAVVERNGKRYCKRHDPEEVRSRRAKREAKRAEQAARDEERYAQEDAARKHAENCVACFAPMLAALKATESWLESFSVPPRCTIEEKEVALRTVRSAIQQAEAK
jgi:hypothetical protein